MIIIDEILVLAPIPADLHAPFLRVAHGLMQRADYPKEKVLGLLAQMLQNPKKYAYSKNKVTNLARAIYDLNKQGLAVLLSEARAAYLPPEPTPYPIHAEGKQQATEFDLRTERLPYAIFGRGHIEEGALLQMETAASLPIAVAGALMPDALNSVSHGAGRLMSRTKALNSITQSQLNRALQEADIQLIGGDLDEAPMVYKDIETVIDAQRELVEVLAKFKPKIVRMADANRKEGRED